MKKLNVVTNKLKAGTFGLLLLITCVLTACSDDNGPEYSKTVLQNTELKNILVQKGYSFNEEGNLLLDDKVNQTTSLDLSGTNISVDALSELSILPNLTDVDLSDNGYTKSFDFTKLPAQITGVDLTGNEIYEYPGLLNIVTQENGDEDVTVLRNLTKLYLPESAKYNCDEIPTYFAKVSGVDMKMANASGTLETYTTLREVPDESFRNILRTTFPSLFVGDNIDISKRLVSATEKNKAISTGQELVESVEGFQYIAQNKGYEGNSIELSSSANTTIPYLVIKDNIYKIGFYNINTPNGIDLTKAENLCVMVMSNNQSITSLDFSSSTKLGQRGDEVEFATMDTPSMLLIYTCDKLESVTLPKAAKAIYSIQLTNLPCLKEIDLSGLETIYMLRIGTIPSCNIKYLDPIRYPSTGNIRFGIDEGVYNRQETKDFLDKYHEHLKQTTLPSSSGATTFKWSSLYK